MNEIEKAIMDLQEYIGSGEYNGSNPPIYLNTANLAISALEKQLTNGWISVKNRFPNMEECQRNDCRFITTDGNRRYQRHYDYAEKVFGEPFHHNTMNFYIDKCVIAWQPLPEKYKEENHR